MPRYRIPIYFDIDARDRTEAEGKAWEVVIRGQGVGVHNGTVPDPDDFREMGPQEYTVEGEPEGDPTDTPDFHPTLRLSDPIPCGTGRLQCHYGSCTRTALPGNDVCAEHAAQIAREDGTDECRTEWFDASDPRVTDGRAVYDAERATDGLPPYREAD